MVRYGIAVKGIVQGVGFRPFAFHLAHTLSLNGFVRNTPGGVQIEIEGRRENCEAFVAQLRSSPPPLAHIAQIRASELPTLGLPEFVILHSSEGAHSALISPDIGICTDCESDILEAGNRRYRYAFTNCTNCGPRFTIIADIPYDRKNTTMADFPLCPDCHREYDDPSDRRFHAQPDACPVCGPQLQFIRDGHAVKDDPYTLFGETIRSGRIAAVKGLGGYHLVCDACSEEAVGRLRERKLRCDKPFAVMMRNLDTVRKFCELNDTELEPLTSPRKPIVLLTKKGGCPVAASVAPGTLRLGVMLPYTPLHYILMQEWEILVMTSGNLSDCPMVYREEEALSVLPQVADGILAHNRRILRRMDDSVCMVACGKPHLLRRARGYVPEPLPLTGNTPAILAVGAQQKNTFCLVRGEDAFLSGHMGDLDNGDIAASCEGEIASFIRLFAAEPEVVACDRHPDYASTRYASTLGLPLYPVQHHHAHFASVLAEHRLWNQDAIGLIFDGSGYGDDGCIWGGEALYGGIAETKRVGHLVYFPLLGGEAAIQEPWRTALAAVWMVAGEEKALALFPAYAEESKILLRAGKRRVNSPLTSSMGRLFDAVAALVGVRRTTTYEGQAAVELQQLIDKSAVEAAYSFCITEDNGGLLFDWRPVIREVLADIQAGTGVGVISHRFHLAVAELIRSAAVLLRDRTHCSHAVLSGGVFQNDFLLDASVSLLEKAGFTVYTNELVPTNDGGIAFGQAAAASFGMRRYYVPGDTRENHEN